MRISWRNLPLLCQDIDIEDSIVTVENYCKWYDLQVVLPTGEIQRHGFDELEGFTESSAYVDHVPNPAAVVRWAASHNYRVDQRSLEMMLGRWLLEARSANLSDEKLLKQFEDFTVTR